MCNAAFLQRGALNMHMRTHTDEKPYKCTICSAAFFRSGILKIHMGTHSVALPFLNQGT